MDDIVTFEAEEASNAVPPLRGVPLREVWRWVAPGIWGVVLVVIFLFGLLSASKAADGGTAAVGYAVASFALIGLGWMLKAQFDGGLPSLMIADGASLVVLAGVLTALAIGGLVLAARGEGVTLPSAGYSMFLVSIGMIYYNLRHYFDCREESRQSPRAGEEPRNEARA